MKTKNLNYLTKEFRSIAVAAGLLIAGTAGLLFAGGAQAGVHELMAGQNIPVGTVTVDLTSTQATVTYDMMTDSDWCLTTVHIDVAENLDDLAVNKKGNPQLGEFDWVDEEIPCLNSYTKTLPIDEALSPPDNECSSGGDVYVAAHAVVTKVGDVSSEEMEALVNPAHIEGMCDNDDGGIVVFNGKPQSYLNTFVDDKNGEEFGNFEGWCLDPEHPIKPNVYYSCNFLDADAASLEGVLPFNENMPYVMWILNQQFVGESSALCGEVYTSDDVQHAIWDYMLNNLDPTDPAFDPTNPFPEEGPDLPFEVECRSHEIRDSALAHGDYQPEAGDLHGIACDTIDPETCKPTEAQDTVFTFRTDMEETAWGVGTRFVEKSSWATYITESCP